MEARTERRRRQERDGGRETGGICLCMTGDAGGGGVRGGERSALTRGFGLEDKKHRQPSKNIYYRLVGLK